MITRNTLTQPADRRLMLERVFSAPPETVFRAWTEASQLARWWAPNGCTIPACEVDARPGGRFDVLMVGPEGEHYPMTGQFEEVAAPERLSIYVRLLDDKGEVAVESRMSVTLTPEGAGTRMTVTEHILSITESAHVYLEGMDQGWLECLEKLDALLSQAG